MKPVRRQSEGCRYWKEGGGNGNRARRRGDWEMPCIRSARAFPKVPPISDRVARYRADYLSCRESVHRKQTYICYETYRRLARILPLLSEDDGACAFLDNVLNAHLKQYEEELDEMVRLGTRNSF